MRAYIKANGFKLWRVVERGNFVPSNLVGEPKPEHERSDQHYADMELNDKAILVLQSALQGKEFFRVSKLSTAKEMWDALEVAHEGRKDAAPLCFECKKSSHFKADCPNAQISRDPRRKKRRSFLVERRSW